MRPVARILLVWLIEAVALVLAAAVLPGVDLDNRVEALVAVALIGVMNAVLWPLLARLTLRLMVLTAGLMTLVLNGALILATAAVLPGFAVDGLGDAVLASLILTAVNLAVSGLLAIDDDGSFYNAVIRRGARRMARPEDTAEPGVFMLEIDGLSEQTLRRAIEGGHVPTIARWLEEGSHRLVPWECDLSCQTSASQAGILLGDNTDIPAFRWYDKAEGRIVVSSSGADCAALEKRLSDGDGLLADDGVSVGNLLSGDAPRSLFTFSTASVRNKPPKDLLGLFANPYGVTRIVTLMLREMAAERWWALRQRMRDEQPRIKRTRKYALTRAGVTVALRDLSTATLMANLFAGTRVAYATFFGYDEVAHHSGIERGDAFRTLHAIDRQFARLERAAALGPRPYEFVVLADHGQSQGATFLQRYGLSLEEVVRDSLTDPHTAGDLGPAQEARAGLGSALNEVADGEGVTSRLADGATPDDAPDTGGARAVVLASGNLGLVYLTEGDGRLTQEEVERLHPDLLPTLVAHDGVSFVRVHSEADGPVVLSRDGSHRLRDGHVEGIDPLVPFGPNAAAHLLRHDDFAHTPDVLVNSLYDPDTEEVAAFEELVGSHGGLGGPQAHPFAVIPSGWEVPEEPIVGTAALHRQLKRWSAPGRPAPSR
ncbi:MAG TPA: phage holin family protein [Thermoleophilaceae bacterium]|nr:phage holin family protein [Thermoleophilaceae bacterium]